MDGLARPLFNNPLDLATVDRALALIEAGPDGAVLDVGCGRGEMLGRALERLPCRGIGVDSNADEIAKARRRLAPYGERATLHASRVEDVCLEPGAFDAVLCVGSSHAFGLGSRALPAALDALARIVRPEGVLLLGEGYWRRDPEPAYLAAAGLDAEEMRPHAENVALGERAGLVPLMAVTSSDTAWDLFESAYWTAAEDRVRAAPADPGAVANAERVRRWRDAYLRWGRTTMGFALYAFRKPRGGSA
jgi:SAM-dependent methyltransferase